MKIVSATLVFIIASLWISNIVFANTDVGIAPTAAKGKIYIFVSSSMSDISIAQWITQANAVGAAVVIRGLVGSDLLHTREWVQNILQQIPNQQGGISIDPQSFQKFDIEQVPAVVVTTGNSNCLPNMSCMPPAYDVVYGNVSLNAALKKIADQHDEVSNVAVTALQKMGGDNATQ